MTRIAERFLQLEWQVLERPPTAGDALYKPAGRHRQCQSIPRRWRFDRSKRAVQSCLDLGELADQRAIDGFEIDEHPIHGKRCRIAFDQELPATRNPDWSISFST